jgi:RNA polymerase sigma-70 factor (ECF subfamily)
MTEHIWNRFKEELLGFIRARVNDQDIAEDLLQEVFVKIHSKANTLSEGDKLAAWVYQITRNTITDYYRKTDRHVFKDSVEANFPEDITYLNKDLLLCLKPFIEKLPDKYRDALLQTSFEDKSQKEYAEENGLSYSAAKSRIQRARVQLKQLFVACCPIKSDKYGNITDIDKGNCSC